MFKSVIVLGVFLAGLTASLVAFDNFSPFLSTANTPASRPVGLGNDWAMIFNDEFDGSELDRTKWHHCYYYACTGWWHLEKQWYTPNNVVVSDGTLKLVAKKESVSPGDGNTYEWTSGMLQSGQVSQKSDIPKFSFTHGYLEGKIKVPEGKGFWPAFWTTGTYDHPPEIDLFEYFSNTNELSQGFWYLENGNKKSTNIGGNLKDRNFANEWHVYGVDWDPNYIAFYLDGELVKKYEGPIMKQAEVHKPQHIVLNFAVGAFFLPNPDSSTPSIATMEVDYIRVWKKLAGTPSPSPVASISPTSTPQVDPVATPPVLPQKNPSDSSACTGPGVYLYADVNYKGNCTRVTSNISDLGKTSVGSDSTSSILVVGYNAKVYRDSNYKGISQVISDSLSNLNGSAIGSDTISSITVTPKPSSTPVPPASTLPPTPVSTPSPTLPPITQSCSGEGVFLYANSGYSGNCTKISSDTPNLNSTSVGSDSVSSIRIQGNFQITLYKDSNYTGQSQSFTSSVDNLNGTSIGSDSASSARLSFNNPEASAGECTGNGIYLYSDTNFSGTCLKVVNSIGNLNGTLIGSDTVSSIKVVGSYSATVFKDASYSGTSVQITSSVSSMSSTSVGNDSISSLTIN